MNKAFNNVFVLRKGDSSEVSVLVTKDEDSHEITMGWELYTSIVWQSKLKHTVIFDKQLESLMAEEIT